MWTNFDLANPYRKETLGYVQACLGLIGDQCLDPPKPKHATVRAFRTIGTAVRKVYNYGLSTDYFQKPAFEFASFD